MKIKFERIDIGLIIVWIIFLIWDIIQTKWVMAAVDASLIVLYVLWLWWYQSREAKKKLFRFP